MIFYLVKQIGLRANDTQDTSVNQTCNEIFPFSRLYLEIIEKYRCPFCGKDTEMYRCTCDAFAKKLAKLQELYGDVNHETQVHLLPYENIYGRGKNITTSIKLLTMKEVCQIDPKLWDKAKKVVDMETNKSFSIINATYDGKDLEFICKDESGSGSIYKCSVKGIGYEHHKIYLGTPRRTPIYRPCDDTSLTRPYENENWRDIAEFADWPAFCKELKN